MSVRAKGGAQGDAGQGSGGDKGRDSRDEGGYYLTERRAESEKGSNSGAGTRSGRPADEEADTKGRG